MFPNVLDNRKQAENATENKNASLFATRCSLCEFQMSSNLSRTQSSGSRERMMTMDWQSLDPPMLCQLCWKSFGGSAIAGRRPPSSLCPLRNHHFFALSKSEPPCFMISVRISPNLEFWMAFKEPLQGARFNKWAQPAPIICLPWIDPT